MTGATGFVGPVLARKLVDDGWDVVALVRPTSDLKRLPAEVEPVVISGDLAEKISRAGGDVCFHLATHFVGVHKPEDIEPLVNSNVGFTAELAEALVHAGVTTIVNTGTAWQHFESEAFSPVSLYAATKQAAQDILQFYAECEQLQVVNLHLFDTYGPNDPRRKLIAALLDAAATGRHLDMSPGEQFIDLLHVEDAAAAFLAAAAARRPGMQTFGASSGEANTIRSVAALVTEISGRPIDVTWGATQYRVREMHESWRIGDPPPGWKPQVRLRDGLQQLWDKAGC